MFEISFWITLSSLSLLRRFADNHINSANMLSGYLIGSRRVLLSGNQHTLKLT
ncbi:MAG TPA: hypothetical protein VKB96_03445 [Gammaproteobacteria bacterium]|nr:hypothetical protein [Gammaproteobacteria bacterium]